MLFMHNLVNDIHESVVLILLVGGWPLGDPATEVSTHMTLQWEV